VHAAKLTVQWNYGVWQESTLFIPQWDRLGRLMVGKAWVLIKDTGSGFIEHEDLSRGAAIAYYTIFSLAPLLIIVIAIAGLVFGHDAAQGAIVGQLRGLIGKQRRLHQTRSSGAPRRSL
jgi:uncharacterized BrkB/YihY/UPF0761 family membrane protein